MYSTKLDCPANVSSVSFAPRSYDIGVLLADNTVALWAPFDTTSQVRRECSRCVLRVACCVLTGY
jgi:hypothetical protein